MAAKWTGAREQTWASDLDERWTMYEALFKFKKFDNTGELAGIVKGKGKGAKTSETLPTQKCMLVQMNLEHLCRHWEGPRFGQIWRLVAEVVEQQ